MLSKIKSTLKTIGFLEIVRFAKNKYKYIVYKIIILLYPDINLQLRFLPVNKINRIIFVHSCLINHWIWQGDNEIPSKIMRHFYLDGNWDLNKKKIFPYLMRKSPTFRSTYQLFVDKVAYTQSDQYKIMKKNLKTTGSTGVWGHCTTDTEIDAYFQNIINAYRDISINGYKTQKELGGSDTDEIRVVIDRNGDVIKVGGGGNHRFPIAKMKKLKCVPVYVIGVHYIWIKKCFDEYGSDVLTVINKGLSMIELDRKKSGRPG